MNLLARLKAAFSPHAYVRAARTPMHDHTSPPFDACQAIDRLGGWSYAAAMLNAHAVAAAPLRLYVRRRPGRKLFASQPVSRRRLKFLAGDHDEGCRPSAHVLQKSAQWGDRFEQVVDPHPALQLLASVNACFNGFELTVLRMLYLQVTGNAYLHAVTDPSLGRPAELWPMPSQWMRIESTASQLIAGYTFGQSAESRRTFQPDDVIHWKLPNLSDLRYGMGRMEAAWSALSLHQSKRTMDLARYENHARPDFLLVVKQGASVEALERFEQQIDRKLRGPRKAGQFIAITGDVDAKPLNPAPDILGDDQRIVEEVAAAFGVPVSKLLTNHPNRAAADTADRAWLRDTILPLCRLDEETLNEQYLPQFGIEDDAFLAYDNPVPEDRAFQLDRRTRYVAAGVMSVEEVREEEGMGGGSDRVIE